MEETELIDEIRNGLKIFLDDLYYALTKRSDCYKYMQKENYQIESFHLASPIQNEKKYQTLKNLFFVNLSVFTKLVVKIEEGANFPYKTRGKRNTLVTIKIHPNLPNYISNISENHTKHAIYNSEFNINISNVDMTQIIPIIFVFDKSTKTGELELLGLHFVELQKNKVIDDIVFIYNKEWIDIYTKETRKYNGSLKVTMFFTGLKEDKGGNIVQKINEKRERISPISHKESEKLIKKIDEGVQTDEYYEKISNDKIEGIEGEINFNMIHNKSSKFAFIGDKEIINDDFVYKSDHENLDIEKILFQDDIDDEIANLLEPSIKYEHVNDLKNRGYNPDDEKNDLFLFDSKKVNDSIEDEMLVKKMRYDCNKYSLYSDFNWNYGFDKF